MKEIKSKEILFNRHIIRFLMWFFCGLGLLIVEVTVLEELFISLIAGIPLMLISLFFILTSPTHYVFSNTELTIKHLWGLKEVIKYKDIRFINEESSSGTRSWFRPIKYYYIAYPHNSKFPLCSEVCKSRKAKRLLEHYTNKEIE